MSSFSVINLKEVLRMENSNVENIGIAVLFVLTFIIGLGIFAFMGV